LLGERHDAKVTGALEKALAHRATPNSKAALAALTSLHAGGLLQSAVLEKTRLDDPTLRAWSARLIGERANGNEWSMLQPLAADPSPEVRGAVAAAARRLTAGAYTINERTTSVANAQVLQLFRALLDQASVDGDTYYPHIVWMAMEPLAAQDPQPFFSLIAARDNSVSAYAARRITRRICDLTDSGARLRQLNAAMEWLAGLSSQPGLAEAALDGLIDAFKGKGQPPTLPLEPIFARLSAQPKLADKARRLATLLGDTSASRALIAKINDANASLDERLKGILAARETKDDSAKAELLRLLKEEKSNQPVLLAGVQALAVFGGDEIGYAMTDAWKNFSLPTRRAAGDVLVTRSKWSRALMAALENKGADPQDVSATARRALAKSADATVVEHATRLLGKYRATDDDKLKLIAARRKVVLSAEGDAANGREVARRVCFVCHKLYGEGADVGPDLTGVGRSSIDALLHNIIDPNEVVGNGYGTTEVELKDGRSVSGRIVEDSPSRLRLVASGPIEHILARSEIAQNNGRPAIRTSELSLMPEGLEQMSDKDFRDMIWYLLNPPGDNRPWTPALRRELFGDENAGQRKSANANAGPDATPPLDLESVALWNPDWRVNCPPFEGAPAKLTEFQGRRNVLLTHPISEQTPVSLERAIDVPPTGATLRFAVAAHDRGDWELRVLVEGKVLHQQVVERSSPRWKKVSIDLKQWAGRRVNVRLENAANGWNFEFGYWAGIDLQTNAQSAAK
jgi:putative heme-binding domain-containing protein